MAQQTGAIYHQGILYSGGSGTNVTPNPQGEATDTLNTVEIDGTVYGIEGGGGSNLIIDAQRYSLDEQVVGIWTDGKPLYKKTFYTADLDYTSTRTNKNVGSISGIDMVVSLTGILSNSAKTQRYEVPFPFASSGNLTTLHYVYDDNCIYFSSTTTWGDSDLYVTILYTKTTDTAGSGGYQAYGFSPIIYSDTEREVGVWRDNKPLYQKTVHLPTLPSTAYTYTTYPHGIQDIDTICGWDSVARWNTGTIRRIPGTQYVDRSENIGGCFDVNITKTGIEIWVGQDRTALNADFTIWYTKTTDVAGSGEYNTLAIPNVHYSTDEQVIGTWINGKPIYRRTWEFNTVVSIAANSWGDTPITYASTNIGKIIKAEAMSAVGFNEAIGATTDNGAQSIVKVFNYRYSTTIEIKYLTLEYTKTTD